MTRVRVGKTRRRALAAIAAFGILAAVPMAVEAAGGPVARGQLVVPTKDTPAAIKTALASDGPVVVAFLLPGITEDEIVQKRLNTLQRSGSFRDTKFIVYRITGKTKLGDLPSMFEIKYTPAIAVIRSDDKLSNVWRGMVDEDIIAQSLIDARNAVPKPSVEGATGNAAGIELARKVNAAYKAVPGVELTGTVKQGKLAWAATFDTSFVNGLSQATSSSLVAGGKTVQSYGDSAGAFSKAAGAKCWTKGSGGSVVADTAGPFVKLAKVRFAKPTKKGANLLLSAVDTVSGVRTVYTVVAKGSTVSHLESVAKGVTGSLDVKALTKAPALAKPTKVC